MKPPIVKTKHCTIYEDDITPLTTDQILDGVLGIIVCAVVAGVILGATWIAIDRIL